MMRASGCVVMFASTADARAIGMFAPTMIVRVLAQVAGQQDREELVGGCGAHAQISSETTRRMPIVSR